MGGARPALLRTKPPGMTWTSNTLKLTDPILLILLILGYWATIVGTLEVQEELTFSLRPELQGANPRKQPMRDKLSLLRRASSCKWESNFLGRCLVPQVHWAASLSKDR